MFHVVKGPDARNYRAAVDEMFRIRYQIYICERGWIELDHENGRERDRFDNPDATYILSFDEEGHVTAGGRFVPTTKPHLLSEVFPHLVVGRPVPRGPTITEWTRIFIHPAHRDSEMLGKLVTAKVEYLVKTGATHMTVVSDTFFIPMGLEIGWEWEYLGPPVNDGRDEYVATIMTINEETLARTRSFYGITQDLVVFGDDSIAASQPAAVGGRQPARQPAQLPGLTS